MFQVSFNQDGNGRLLNIKHGNLFSHYYTILINKVTMTREICQGITLIMKNRAKNRAKIRSNKMAALRDTKLWFFKLDFQRNELVSTTVFLTGHKKTL